MSDDVLYDGSGNQIVQASGESGGDPIGFVMTSTGTVTVERADGTVEQLSAGDPVFEDDILTTGDDSTVGIRFQDESRFSLGEDGRMELDTFVYDAVAGTGTSLIDVAEGSFAFVSGMIAKTGDDAMSVQTPVATIGVRGTTVAGDVGPDGQTEVTLLPDTDGTLGEIAVFNQSGLQIMFDAFQRVDIGGSDIAPTAPRTIDPTELRADIADTVRAIGADPSGGRSRSDNEEDGGGSDAVEEAAADPTGAADDIDISEEIDVAESETVGGVDILEEVDMADLELELSEEDLAALNEAEMDRAAEEVAEIDVAAGGDRAVVRMADGTEVEISASDLAAGKFVGPSGTVIDLDISLADATRIYEQARSRQEEKEEEEDGVRDAPNTFQNDIIAADLNPGVIDALGNIEQTGPIPGPELPTPPSNAAEDNPDIGLGVLPPDLPPGLTNPDGDITLGIDPIPEPGPDPILAEPPPPPQPVLDPDLFDGATGPGASDDNDEDEGDDDISLGVEPSEDDDDESYDEDDDDSLDAAPTADDDDESDDDDDEDDSIVGPPVQTLDDLNDSLDNVIGGAGQLVAGELSEDDDDVDDADDDSISLGAATSADDDDDSVEGPPVQTLDDLNDSMDNVVGGAGQLVAGGSDQDDGDDEDDDGVILGAISPAGDDDGSVDDESDAVANEPLVQTLDELDDTSDDGDALAGSSSDNDDDDSVGAIAAPLDDDGDAPDGEEVDQGVDDSPLVQTLDDPVEDVETVLAGDAPEGGGSDDDADDDTGPVSAQAGAETSGDDDSGEGDGEVFNLAAPQLPQGGIGDDDPLDDDDNGPMFGGDDLPEDSAVNSPLTVENGLSFGDDTNDEVVEDVADDDGEDDIALGEDDDEGVGDDDEGVGDDDEPSMMEQLNLGETVDDTQNLLDNFLHPEESDDEGASDNDDDAEDSDDDDDAPADDNAALLGGVFSGIYSGNDDPPDDGNGVY
ncbi:MAG: FecR family protein [Alphaproteobacteria bacterium]|nr:FecR family protein [Alphaproteobacteria bacterium]